MASQFWGYPLPHKDEDHFSALQASLNLEPPHIAILLQRSMLFPASGKATRNRFERQLAGLVEMTNVASLLQSIQAAGSGVPFKMLRYLLQIAPVACREAIAACDPCSWGKVDQTRAWMGCLGLAIEEGCNLQELALCFPLDAVQLYISALLSDPSAATEEAIVPPPKVLQQLERYNLLVASDEQPSANDIRKNLQRFGGPDSALRHGLLRGKAPRPVSYYRSNSVMPGLSRAAQYVEVAQLALCHFVGNLEASSLSASKLQHELDRSCSEAWKRLVPVLVPTAASDLLQQQVDFGGSPVLGSLLRRAEALRLSDLFATSLIARVEKASLAPAEADASWRQLVRLVSAIEQQYGETVADSLRKKRDRLRLPLYGLMRPTEGCSLAWLEWLDSSPSPGCSSFLNILRQEDAGSSKTTLLAPMLELKRVLCQRPPFFNHFVDQLPAPAAKSEAAGSEERPQRLSDWLQTAALDADTLCAAVTEDAVNVDALRQVPSLRDSVFNILFAFAVANNEDENGVGRLLREAGRFPVTRELLGFHLMAAVSKVDAPGLDLVSKAQDEINSLGPLDDVCKSLAEATAHLSRAVATNLRDATHKTLMDLATVCTVADPNSEARHKEAFARLSTFPLSFFATMDRRAQDHLSDLLMALDAPEGSSGILAAAQANMHAISRGALTWACAVMGIASCSGQRGLLSTECCKTLDALWHEAPIFWQSLDAHHGDAKRDINGSATDTCRWLRAHVETALDVAFADEGNNARRALCIGDLFSWSLWQQTLKALHANPELCDQEAFNPRAASIAVGFLRHGDMHKEFQKWIADGISEDSFRRHFLRSQSSNAETRRVAATFWAFRTFRNAGLSQQEQTLGYERVVAAIASTPKQEQQLAHVLELRPPDLHQLGGLLGSSQAQSDKLHYDEDVAMTFLTLHSDGTAALRGIFVELALHSSTLNAQTQLRSEVSVTVRGAQGERLAEDACRLNRSLLESVVPHMNIKAKEVDQSGPLPAGDTLLRLLRLIDELARDLAFGFVAPGRMFSFLLSKENLDGLLEALAIYAKVWGDVCAHVFHWSGTGRMPVGYLPRVRFGTQGLALLDTALCPESPLAGKIDCYLEAGATLPSHLTCKDVRGVLQAGRNMNRAEIESIVYDNLQVLEDFLQCTRTSRVLLPASAFASDVQERPPQDGALTWITLVSDAPASLSALLFLQSIILGVERFGRSSDGSDGGWWPRRSDIFCCSGEEGVAGAATARLGRFLEWVVHAPPDHNRDGSTDGAPLAFLLFPSAQSQEEQIEIASLLSRCELLLEGAYREHGRRLLVVTLQGHKKQGDGKGLAPQLESCLQRLAGDKPQPLLLSEVPNATRMGLAALLDARSLHLSLLRAGPWGSARGGKSHQIYETAFQQRPAVPPSRRRPLRLSSKHSLAAFLTQFHMHPYEDIWIEAPGHGQMETHAQLQPGQEVVRPLEDIVFQLVTYGKVHTEDETHAWQPQGRLNLTLELHWQGEVDATDADLALAFPLIEACTHMAGSGRACGSPLPLQLDVLPHIMPELSPADTSKGDALPAWLVQARQLVPSFLMDVNTSPSSLQQHHRAARVAFWLFCGREALARPDHDEAKADFAGSCAVMTASYDDLRASKLYADMRQRPADGSNAGAACGLFAAGFVVLPSLRRMALRQWPFVRVRASLERAPDDVQKFLRTTRAAGELARGYEAAAHEALAAGLEDVFGAGALAALVASDAGRFVLSPYVMLRLLILGAHFAMGMPIVLEGETGVGKTRLMKAFHLLVSHAQQGSGARHAPGPEPRMQQIDLHPGVDDAALVRELERRLDGFTLLDKAADASATPTWDRPPSLILFVDEVNCGPPSVVEILRGLVVDRQVAFSDGRRRRLARGAWVACACNPAGDTSRARYFVEQLPASMESVRWTLDALDERDISYIVAERLLAWWPAERLAADQQSGLVKAASDAILAGHRAADSFGEEGLDDQDAAPAVSLRDLNRLFEIADALSNFCPQLLDALQSDLEDGQLGKAGRHARALAVGTAIVYLLRVPHEARLQVAEREHNHLLIVGLKGMAECAASLCQEMQLDQRRVALPFTGLRETMLALYIYFCARVPLFLIGAPGTSKSLCLSLLVQSLMNHGLRSASAVLSRAPVPNIYVLQCSPALTPSRLLATFKRARSWVAAGEQPLLVLEEMGLVTSASKVPAIKALHAELDHEAAQASSERVAFIGVSNTFLDAAKMNRGGIVSRAHLDENERLEIAKIAITGGYPCVPPLQASTVASLLATSVYNAMCTSVAQTTVADAFGSRDYFSVLLRLWRNEKADSDSGALRDDAVAASLQLVEGVPAAFEAVRAAWMREGGVFAASCKCFKASTVDAMVAHTLCATPPGRLLSNDVAGSGAAEKLAWDVSFHDRPLLLLTSLQPQEWWLQEVVRRGEAQAGQGGSSAAAAMVVLWPTLPHLATPDADTEALLDLLSSNMERGGPIVAAAGCKTLSCLLDVVNGHSIATGSALGEREARIARGGVSVPQRIHASTRLAFVARKSSLLTWSSPIKQRLVKVELCSEKEAEDWTLSLMERLEPARLSEHRRLFEHHRMRLLQVMEQSPCHVNVDALLMASCCEGEMRGVTTVHAMTLIWQSHGTHGKLWDRKSLSACDGLVKTEADRHVRTAETLDPFGYNVCHRVLGPFVQDEKVRHRCPCLPFSNPILELSNDSVPDWATQLTSGACIAAIVTSPAPALCVEVVSQLFCAVEDALQDNDELPLKELFIELDGAMYSAEQLAFLMDCITLERREGAWRGAVHLVVYAPLTIDDPFDEEVQMVPGWRIHACLGGKSNMILKDSALGTSKPAELSEKELMSAVLRRHLRGFRCANGIVGLLRTLVSDVDGKTYFCWPSMCLSSPLRQLLDLGDGDGRIAPPFAGHTGVFFLAREALERFAQSGAVCHGVPHAQRSGVAVSTLRSRVLRRDVASMAKTYLKKTSTRRMKLSLQDSKVEGRALIKAEVEPDCGEDAIKQLQETFFKLHDVHRRWQPSAEALAKLSDPSLCKRAAEFAGISGRYAVLAGQQDCDAMIKAWCEHKHCVLLPASGGGYTIVAALETLADDVEQQLQALLAAVVESENIIDLQAAVKEHPLVKQWPESLSAAVANVRRSLNLDRGAIDEDGMTLTYRATGMDLSAYTRELHRRIESVLDVMRLWCVPVVHGALRLAEVTPHVARLDTVPELASTPLTLKGEEGSFDRLERRQAEAAARLQRWPKHQPLAESLMEQHQLKMVVDTKAGEYEDETHIVVSKTAAEAPARMVLEANDDAVTAEGGGEANAGNNDIAWVFVVGVKSDLERQMNTWSVAECCVCMTPCPVGEGLFCDNAAAPHFLCRNDLNDTVMNSVSPEKLGKVIVVPCAENCDAKLSEYLLQKRISKEASAALDKAKQEIVEVKLQQEYDQKLRAELKRRLAEELERLEQMDAAEREVYRHRTFICEQVLNDKCPRCDAVFDYEGGCMAFTCIRNSCSAGFCGYCFVDCGGDAHSHAAGCGYLRPQHGGLWSDDYRGVQRARRERKIREYVGQISDVEQHNALVNALVADVADMGITLPAER